MPFHPSQRALDFMRCVVPEQRRYFRVHLPIQGIAVFRELGEGQHAFLRDINMLGAFFYCKHKPKIGQRARLEFPLPAQTDQLHAICEGSVVRVEEPGPEAAIGVAMEFASYKLSRLPEKHEVENEQRSGSFIRWTVDMVQRIFDK
jgi:PilZ domain